jgi:hypothetical protein
MHRLLAILLAAVPAAAQLPEFYRTVDRVVWVVGDADRVTEGWSKTGLLKVQKRAESAVNAESRGRPPAGKSRAVSGWLGNLRADWIQPLDSASVYADFRKKHGDGIFAILHRTPAPEALDAEIERLRALGVAVLQRGEQQGARYVYFDTAPQGKYVLGLVCGGETGGPAPEEPKINQLAFAAHDLQPISSYWEKMGFPVEDMDRAIAEWGEAGFRVTQSGAWGQAGRKGSGRFAYLDTEKIGGVALELLWNLRDAGK